MNALLIGADRLGNIPNLLETRGIEDFTHWDGRKKGMRKLKNPYRHRCYYYFYRFYRA